MLNETFKRAAKPPEIEPIPPGGPLRADLIWTLNALMVALNETPWGQIAPQIIAAAATDREARSVINELMKERIAGVELIFKAAEGRGELPPGTPVRHIVETAIAVPYFRKLIVGAPLDQQWLESHVDMICRMTQES